MSECDGFFDEYDILFEESYADQAIHIAWVTYYRNPVHAKYLIQCWFDVTFGQMTGPRFNARNSRSKMAQYLATTPYRTYEDLLAVVPWIHE